MNKKKVMKIKEKSLRLAACLAAVVTIMTTASCNKKEENPIDKEPELSSSSVPDYSMEEFLEEKIPEEEIALSRKEYPRLAQFTEIEYFTLAKMGIITGTTEEQSAELYKEFNNVLAYYNLLYPMMQKSNDHYVDRVLAKEKSRTFFEICIEPLSKSVMLGTLKETNCFRIVFIDSEDFVLNPNVEPKTMNPTENTKYVQKTDGTYECYNRGKGIFINGVLMTEYNAKELLNEEIAHVFKVPMIPYYAIYAANAYLPYQQTDTTREMIFQSWYQSGLNSNEAYQKMEDYLKEQKRQKNIPSEYKERYEEVITLIKKQMQADSYQIFDAAYPNLKLISTQGKMIHYDYFNQTIDLGNTNIKEDHFIYIMKEAFTISKEDASHRNEIQEVVYEFTHNQMGKNTLMGILIEKYGREKVLDHLLDKGYTSLLKEISTTYDFYEVCVNLSQKASTDKEKQQILDQLKEELGLKETVSSSNHGHHSSDDDDSDNDNDNDDDEPSKDDEPPKIEDEHPTPPSGGQEDETEKPTAKPDDSNAPPKEENNTPPSQSDEQEKPTAQPGESVSNDAPPSVSNDAPPSVAAISVDSPYDVSLGHTLQLVLPTSYRSIYKA